MTSTLPDHARQHRTKILDGPEPPKCPYNNVYPQTRHPDGLNARTCPTCVTRNRWVAAIRREKVAAGEHVPNARTNRGSQRNQELRRPVPKCGLRHASLAEKRACERCKRRARYTEALRRDAHDAGDPMIGLVDAAEAVQHLTAVLMPSGLSLHRISALSGVDISVLGNAINGHRKKIHVLNATAILSVPPLPYRQYGKGNTINATGTRRKLRGLYAQGWLAGYMASLIGTSRGNLWQWIAGRPRGGHKREFVSTDVADAAQQLVDKLGGFDIAELDEPMDGMSRRCAQRAAKRGWNTLSDWDGLDIDDPRVTPHAPDPLDASNGLVLVDDDRVKQALGFLPTEAADGTLSVDRFGRPLTMMEVCEVIRIGSERDYAGEPRFSANLLAQRLGVAERTVQRRRAMMTRADLLLGGPSPRAGAATAAAVILSADGWPATLRLKVAADLLRIDPLQPAGTARHLLILGATQPSPIGRNWSDTQLADWLGCDEQAAVTLRGKAVLAARQYLEFPAEGETGPPRQHSIEFPAAA